MTQPVEGVLRNPVTWPGPAISYRPPFRTYMIRVAEAYGVSIKDLIGGEKRDWLRTLARAELAWTGYYVFGYGSPKVARLLGLKNHSSVVYRRQMVNRGLMAAYGVEGFDAIGLPRQRIREVLTGQYDAYRRRQLVVQKRRRRAEGRA